MSDKYLKGGKFYHGTIHLGMFESVVSDEYIAGQLSDAGFIAVTVTGSGGTRYARGRWSQADGWYPLDRHFTDVTEE